MTPHTMPATAFEPGTELRTLRKGPLATSHIVRWCAAQRNWDKMHYDLAYAKEVAGLPGLIVNGALKQQYIAQFLDAAFAHAAWLWRIDYRFHSPDFLGQALEVRGRVREIREAGDLLLVMADATIHNLELDEDTTSAAAIVVLARSGAPLTSLPNRDDLPAELRLSDAVGAAEGDVPAGIAARLGTRLENVASICPLERSRLLLFADAVGDLPPWHYDERAGRESPFGDVVAPPLYPIHGLEVPPGSRPLSADPNAVGREGVAEVGRNLMVLLDVPFGRFLNGGNQVEISSLAAIGETIDADSTLVSARIREGRRSGSMLLIETLNRYVTRAGRHLMTERQTFVYR